MLCTEDGRIVAPANVLHQEAGCMIFSVYQDPHIREFFNKNWRNKHYLLQGKVYLLDTLLFDVVEYDLPKIKALFDFVIEGLITISTKQLEAAIRQEPLLPDEYGPKGILLVLVEEH